MDYIYYDLALLVELFICIVIIQIYMKVTSYIGEQLGVSKFFIYLWQKTRKKIMNIRLLMLVKNFLTHKDKMRTGMIGSVYDYGMM